MVGRPSGDLTCCVANHSFSNGWFSMRRIRFQGSIVVGWLGTILFSGSLLAQDMSFGLDDLGPALICGAFAERMKFKTMVVFSVLWGILVKILDATMGLRVAQQEETLGLDISQHGEEGYLFI
jgi:hypothetical protein